MVTFRPRPFKMVAMLYRTVVRCRSKSKLQSCIILRRRSASLSFNLNNVSVNSLSWADGLVLISRSKPGLQHALDKLDSYCTKWELNVNTKKNKTKYIFTNSIVDSWNSLPSEVVNAPSLNAFKNRLDKFWMNHPMKFNASATHHLMPNYDNLFIRLA